MTVYAANDGREHVALTLGDRSTFSQAPVLMRVHSECLTGDAFASLRCDCGPQLQAAMANVAEAGRGIILYLRQEGRGIGLGNKLRAYALQDTGLDTVEANHQLGFEADLRRYDIALLMLQDLGVQQVRLMTNNPRKVAALAEAGIEVVDRVPIEVGRNLHNEGYLHTKTRKLGHWLNLP
jgi:GTP cyclohydrolase II